VSLPPSELKRRLAATGRDRGDHDLNPGMAPADPMRAAAVLVPLVDRPDGVTVLLTRRTEHLHHHAGQISFPGGRIEASDGSPEEAALRETEEEVGLGRRHVELLGRLDLYRTRTGFEVTPVVGWVTPPFDIAPDRFEVAEVFEVPLDFVVDPHNHERHSRQWQGVTRHFYVLPYGGYYIWGATAGMLVNLAERLAP
jgi:8-oxo-dGTP pyrophosphatase MutT (NUDIX family)